ncbi:MAG: Rrf2 family transcriptional regulator [Chloroflexi bacterium]|nr:Rrf2 family transcriptional regulator [Chloroflexota bacterium]
MKFSSKGHYGLRAMTTLARTYGSGPVALADIAEAEQLSLGYLEQLVATLRRAGLVKGTRGVRGGYRLAAEPSSLTVGEILRVLEGPIVLAECASEIAEPGCCEREESCPSRQVWQRMRDTMVQVLDSTTLADLCRGQPPAA